MNDPVPKLRKLQGLNLDPRHEGFAYQLQAVEAVRALPFAAIFHEQGLGKTKIGIDLALEWLRTDTVDSILFVTKRGLVQNWVEELHAHTNIRPRVLDQNHSSNFFSLNSPARFFLTHYEVLKSEERRFALFQKTRRVAAILDEAQKIKNPEADLSKALHRLRDGFARRIIMTGTPVANRPYDLWSQIYFLDGGEALGSDFESFKEKLDLTNDLWRDDRRREVFEGELARLYALIQPFCVRETKDSSGIELPEKRIQNVPVEMGREQQRLYDSIRENLSAEVMRDGQRVIDDSEGMLKRLLRLVQVASNPQLVDESYTESPGKLLTLQKIVGDAIRAGSKIIVWTSFVANADWLTRELSDFGATVVHGGRTIEDRNASIAKFKTDDECRVLVATPGAAKEGLTLTMANQAVFYDRSFSLDDYLQAQDRIHRISQTQTCYIWNLISLKSVDEWVDALLTAKRLAAQLAQSDISAEQYSQNADYGFGKLVREILGLE